ncbi:MAG: tetratricopeptide repeat protein [Deltaproteobacteria bacterium]|nr:tetratricopeptide repeat protein [Deltaproteobacteria bacterium]
MLERTLTFLVVENDSVMRKTHVYMLNNMGYTEIHQAGDGTEAWTLFKNNEIDFVISAWDIPEMNGLVLLKVIRADIKHISIPFLMITESVTRAQVIEAGEAGLSDLITLPFTEELFRHKIEHILQVAMDPKQIEAENNFQLGVTLMNEERWEEALSAFQGVLSVLENAEVYYNMGYIYTAQGNYDEAILCLRKATQINNAFARAYRMMGQVYIKIDKPKEAVTNLQKAADLYMDKDMDENAESILLQVAELNPNTLNVYNSLGIIYRKQGKYDLAVEQYQKAIKVDAEDEHIYYNLSRVYLVMKDFTNASNALKKALEFSPDFTEAKELLNSIEMGRVIK